MSRLSHYGTGQRAGFALMIVAFAFCAAGCFSPYWIKADLNASELFDSVSNNPTVAKLLGQISVVKVNLGLWFLCLDYGGIVERCATFYHANNHEDYHFHNRADEYSWIDMVRLTAVLNLKLGLICVLAALCRCCCCTGGKTICHGVMAFLAGVFGFAAVGIMSTKRESLSVLPLLEVDFGWSFGIYIAGCAIMIVAALLLGFSLPKESPNGVVLYPSSGPFISVAQTTHTSAYNQYELNGQVQHFEPLPNPDALRQPAQFNQQTA